MVKFYTADEIDEILRLIDDPGFLVPVKEESVKVNDYLRVQIKWHDFEIKKINLEKEIINIKKEQSSLENIISGLRQNIEEIVDTIKKEKKK